MLLNYNKGRVYGQSVTGEKHRAEAASERTGVGQQSLGSAGLMDSCFVRFLHT